MGGIVDMGRRGTLAEDTHLADNNRLVGDIRLAHKDPDRKNPEEVHKDLVVAGCSPSGRLTDIGG